MKTKHFVWSLGVALMLVPLSKATTTWTGATDTDWNTAGNWSAGVPGVTDPVAVVNLAGTIDVSSAPLGTSAVDLRINTAGSSSGAKVVNWNPGAANTTDFAVLYAGAGGINAGTTAFNHQSGTIDMTSVAATYQFRVGNANEATYTMSNNARVEYIEGVSIGQSANGNGYMVMNDTSSFVDQANAGASALFLIGNNATAARGELTMNDSSFAFHRNNVRVGANDGAIGTVTMNNTASFDIRNNLQLGYNGEGHLVMGDNSILRVGVGAAADLRVGHEVTGRATVTMSQNAQIIGGGGTTDDAHVGFNGDGTLVMNDSSSITGFREFSTSHNNGGSESTLTMNGNSLIEARTFVNIGRFGTSTVTLNDNARISNAENSPFNLGAQTGSNATLIMDGAGSSVHANQNLNVGAVNNAVSTSVFDQNAGEVFVNGALFVGNAAVGNAATYNLDGGILRSNNITVDAANGTFNWGAGTMTVREVAQNASGDGSVITYTGDLASSAGSVLDLQNLYTAGSTRFDTLAVSGNLDLSAAGDVLDFWINVQSLRSIGGVVTGELQLISAGSVSGTFDNIIAPGSDGLFFRTLLAGEVAQGTAADALTVNRGYLDYRGDGVYFVYKVNGQVPEPETGMLLVFAVLFLRGLSKRSWLVILRQALKR